MSEASQEEIERLLSRPGFARVARAVVNILDRQISNRSRLQGASDGLPAISIDECLRQASCNLSQGPEPTETTSLHMLQRMVDWAEAYQQDINSGHGETSYPQVPVRAGGLNQVSRRLSYSNHHNFSPIPPSSDTQRYNTTSNPGTPTHDHREMLGSHVVDVSQRPPPQTYEQLRDLQQRNEVHSTAQNNERYYATYSTSNGAFAASTAQSTPRIHQNQYPHTLNELRYDPPLGLLPHLYQTSASLQPSVRWPVNSNIHSPAPYHARRPSRADQQGSQPRTMTGSSSRSDGDAATKALYETFKQKQKPKKFFRVGRVFMILWTEPLGDERLSETSQFTFKGLYNDWLHQKVRRFIVIGEAERHCLAIPIMSYGNKGVSKQGVNKADHGIVYVGTKVPEADKDELPARNELPMVEVPIRVDPDDPTEKLAPHSRIHYSKVYTIEHNVKARSVGMIHSHSVPDLLYQTKSVWTRTPNGLGALGITPGRKVDADDSADSAPDREATEAREDQPVVINPATPSHNLAQHIEVPVSDLT